MGAGGLLRALFVMKSRIEIMSREALKTLLHPFASGIIDPPGEGSRGCCSWVPKQAFVLPEGFAAVSQRRAGLPAALPRSFCRTRIEAIA